MENELEEVSCNICNCNDYKPLFKKEFHVVKCKKCGLVYVNPRLTKSISEEESKEGLNWHLKAQEANDELVGFYEGLLHRFQRYRKTRRILDVGCGTGVFLHIARKNEWEVYGTELFKQGAEYAKEAYNIDIFQGELKGVNFANSFFDVVTLFEVIEHLQNPLEYLKEIFRILRKGGFLFLTTPNLSSLNFLIRREKWCVVTPSSHIYYFTATTIRKILGLAGFKILELKVRGFNLTNLIILDKPASSEERIYFQVRKRKFFKKFLKPSVNFFLSLFKKGDTLFVLCQK